MFTQAEFRLVPNYSNIKVKCNFVRLILTLKIHFLKKKKKW